MAEGWVKLHRSMLDSPIFSNAELLRLWVYLLMHAAHTEVDIITIDGSFKPQSVFSSI